MLFALSQTTGYIIVGVVATIPPSVAAVLAYRAHRETSKLSSNQQATDAAITVQGSLIDDLREDLETERTERRKLAGEMTALRLAFDECDTERTALAGRVAELERTG